MATDTRAPTPARSMTAPAEPEPGKKPGLVDRVKGKLDDLRHRVPFVDHVFRTLEHYSAAQGGTLAGATTYFGLLSFFPILALIFAILGFVSSRFDVEDEVLDAMRNVLPGLFDSLNTTQIQDAAATASIIGIVGFLYSGLGWLSALRGALQTMFAVPKESRGNFFLGKITDILVLASLGLVLLVSVASSSIVTSLTDTILEAVGLADVPGMTFLVRAVGIAIGVLASTLLFFVIFRLLGKPDLPARALLHGALFSAIGFEVLKLLATTLIAGTIKNDVYGPFALVIALLIWINYFARLTMFGASWAATTPPADEVVEERQTREAVKALEELQPELLEDGSQSTSAGPPNRDRGALVAGAVLGAAAVGLAVSVRRVAEDKDG